MKFSSTLLSCVQLGRRKPLRVLFCLLLVCSLVAIISIGARERYRLVRDALYLLRPAWDKPNSAKHLARPWIQLTNYNHPNMTPSERCASFGWGVRPHDANFRVIDATLFTVELDMLEIRLEELWPYIDVFLIVEANITFTGLPKPLIFQEIQYRFAWAESKIIYRQHCRLPTSRGRVTICTTRLGQ